MNVLYLILLLLAAACFAADASNKVAARVNLSSLGLLFWVLVPLLVTIRGL